MVLLLFAGFSKETARCLRSFLSSPRGPFTVTMRERMLTSTNGKRSRKSAFILLQLQEQEFPIHLFLPFSRRQFFLTFPIFIAVPPETRKKSREINSPPSGMVRDSWLWMYFIVSMELLVEGSWTFKDAVCHRLAQVVEILA